MILLIIGSSTDPAFFHAGCRPIHHVGLFPTLTSDLLVRKACPTLTYDLLIRKACPVLTFDLLIRKAHPALTSDHVVNYNHIRNAQHSHSLAR